MAMHGPHPDYLPPSVCDYGTLVDVTAAVHPFFGTAAPHDLSFSGATAGSLFASGGGGTVPAGTPGGGDPSGVTNTLAHGVAGVVGEPGGAGGGSAGGGGAGAGGGPAGGLPFTGFAVGAAAAVGGTLVAFGGALRNRLRRSHG